MTSYEGYAATHLEVNTNAKPPYGVVIRLYVGWGVTDAYGNETAMIFGGYIDIDASCLKDNYHHVVARMLRQYAKIWEEKTQTDGSFIFDAMGNIMEVLGDGKSTT